MQQSLLTTLWQQQKGLCYYCRRPMYGKKNPKAKGSPLLMATEDHKRPKSEGGGRGDNIVLACRECNSDKNNLNEQEYQFIRILRSLTEPNDVHRIPAVD
jgi:5-methylcytosine-specific restriction endonuclease McrA